ncbi:MAG: 1-deoxy-D-xylulose-5-phosphate synthase [Spirochaetaceae bacterium]|jgi:transketolase|nr:1-deoxy-D-xylulose-5-phosphate synthase [Spirochaetaceae bacterium]
MTAMRDAYGKKLAALGEINKKIVVLDADLSGSTRSSYFGKAFPDRFFNVGVSEGNMAGTAAGFAAAGFMPVINTFSIFITLKCCDQIRHDFCYNKLPVVISGAYGGFSDSYDGASHQAIEDIAIMRALPGMEVIVPADNRQAELAIEYAVKQDHPVFLRLSRNEVADIPDSSAIDTKTPIKLKDGNMLTIAATGLTTQAAIDAAAILEKKGISAEVFTIPFVKPLEGGALEESVKKTGKLVTIEEHSIVGGFGSACVEKITQSGILFKWLPIGVNDTFGDTGSYKELLNAYGLTSDSIAAKSVRFAV